MSFWAKVFSDQPVSEARLGVMRKNIMQEIMAAPQDFSAELELKHRRQGGLLLIALVLGIGAGVMLMFYLQLSWLGEVWLRLAQLMNQLARLREGVTVILNAYTIPLLAMSIAWLLAWTEMRGVSSQD